MNKQAPAIILAGSVSEAMSFVEKAWTVCSRVPAGKVTTYGAIAKTLGVPGGARAVGMAMNRNPYAPQVPCHRVVASDGKLTGYAGGLDKKRAMLLAEGVKLKNDRVARECVIEL